MRQIFLLNSICFAFIFTSGCASNSVPPPPSKFDDIVVQRIHIEDYTQSPTRAAPTLPPSVKESGHCKVLYDIDEAGKTYKIRTTSCTHGPLANISVEEVKSWTYEPKIVDGTEVKRIGIEAIVTYRVTDEQGNTIPEPKQ